MQARVTTTSGSLNLRQDKSTLSASLMKIPKGATVSVLDSGDASWWRIQYIGVTGYVMAQYLTPEAEEEDNSNCTEASEIRIQCAHPAEA